MSLLRATAVAALLFLLGSTQTIGHAEQQQAEPAHAILTSLRVTGSKKFSSDQIVAATGLRVGQTVARDDFQAAADRLGRLGVFSSVRYEFSSQGQNVGLEFRVEDAPSVPVAFDNFPWFTDGELEKAIRDAVNVYDGTAPEQGTYVDAIAAALTKLLATRGVNGAVEHVVLERPDGDGMMQQFRIAGASLSVGSVEFGDALAGSDVHVQERLSDLVGKPYSRYTVEVFEIEQVRPIYLSKGYLQVSFGRPQARFTGDPNRPLPDRVTVIAPIRPGLVFHWGGATWSGNRVLPSSALDNALGFHAGQPADGMAIIAGWDRVRAAYGAQGYLDAKVEPVAEFDEPRARASYRVNITEGPQYHMGELVVTGLSVEAERRLREAWRISAGQVFDQGYYEEFLKNIVKEAFAGLPVHYNQIGRWLRRNPQTLTVDVLLDFQ